MHQHDQRSVSATFAVLASRQSNRNARESFFPHVQEV
jgi:hypothetical protein